MDRTGLFDLELIETCIKQHNGIKAFPPKLEQAYLFCVMTKITDTLEAEFYKNMAHYHVMGILCAIGFGAYYRYVILSHAVTHLAAHFIRRFRPRLFHRPHLWSICAIFVPISIVVEAFLFSTFLHTEFASIYIYVAMLPLMIITVTIRLPFRLAKPFIAFIFVIVLAQPAISMFFFPTFVHSEKMSKAILLLSFILIPTLVHAAIYASRSFEKETRLSFLTHMRDKIALKMAEKSAYSDALTGLNNRRFLEHMVNLNSLCTCGDNVALNSEEIAVIMIDVDDFKAYNDNYGHTAGDEVLKRVAIAIKESCQTDDEVAIRYGGEEFMVLIRHSDLIHGRAVAERIRDAIQKLGVQHNNSSIASVITASLGVAVGSLYHVELNDIIKNADQALYAAKKAGRNCVWPPSELYPLRNKITA